MLYRALLRFFAKREGKIHSNFDKQKLFYLASCIANCIRRRFLITQFVATEALGKNTLADRTVHRLFSPICVSAFTNVLVFHFKLKFDQLFVQRVLLSRLTSNLQI